MRIHTRFLILTLTAALVLAGAVSCRQPQQAASSNELEIRTYTVPVDDPNFNLLNDVKGLLGDHGEARKLRDGVMVVTAPASLHAGVAEVIRAAAAGGSVGEPHPTVSIDYWAVIGRGAEAAAEESLSSPAIRDALAAVTRYHGPLEFELVDSARLSSMAEGRPASINGRRLAVQQRVVTVGESTVVADLELTVQNDMRRLRNWLETRVRLEPGTVVVLGQAAYDTANGWLPDGWQPEDDVLLFYVVTATVD